ncbi:MAG: hypothetical protein ACO3FO_07000 [Candidatus Nanopelagicaceae bacterium]
MEVVEKFIEVSYFKEDGTINEIDLTDTFNLAYFTALVNNADETLRWYPLPFVKNMVDERADSDFETFDDKTKIERQVGIRSVKTMITTLGNNAGAVSPQMVGKINDKKCKVSGLFGITKSKQLVGEMINDGFLAPIRIDNGSISAKLIKTGSGATTQKIDLSFDWHIDVQDERLRTLEADEMSTDISLLNGLLDVTATYSEIGQTSFKATLKTQYGSYLNPVLVEGLVAGDMALYNVTDSASVAISSAVENPDGTYLISFTSQTVADVLRLTITKNGYNFDAVTAATITVV